jgi:hypothetical protein
VWYRVPLLPMMVVLSILNTLASLVPSLQCAKWGADSGNANVRVRRPTALPEAGAALHPRSIRGRARAHMMVTMSGWLASAAGYVGVWM